MNNTTDSVISPYEIPPYLFTDPSALTIFKAFGLGLLILLTIFGNLLVIVAVVPSPTLRTPTHSLIVNLAVADLLLGITVLPLSAAQELLDGAWLLGPTLCSAWKTLDVLCCTASILSLCGISIDRYVGVSRPLAYSRIITKRRARILIAAIWALAIAISIAPPLGWKEEEEELLAVNEPKCQVNKQLGYVIFSACGSFYIPALVTSVLYFLVYRAASRHSKFLSSGTRVTSRDVTLRVHMGNAHTGSCGRSSICDGHPVHKLSSGSCGSAATLLMSNANGINHVNGHHLQQQPHDPLAVPPGHRYSGDSCGTPSTTPTSEGWSVACEQGRRLTAAGVYGRAAKFRRQKKAAKTLGIVVGFFLLCWFPFFIMLPLDAACTSCDLSVPFNWAFWLGYLNSCINPFIYACSSRDLRRAFRSILCLRRYRGANSLNGSNSIVGSRRRDTATSRRASAFSTTASMRGCASTISTTMNPTPCNHTLCTVVPGSRSTSVSISLLRRTPSPR